MAGGRTRTFAVAVAGAVAAVFGAGIGELIAVQFASASGPFTVVGGAMIDAAPAWAKDTAIALFGTADKAALLIGIGVVLIAVCAAAGVLDAHRRPAGELIALALGGGAAALAHTRPDAGSWAWLPSAVAGVAAAVAMRFLVPIANGERQQRRSGAGRLPAERHRTAADKRAPAGDATTASARDTGTETTRSTATVTADRSGSSDEIGAASGGTDRRSFLAWAGGATLIGVVGLVVGGIARGGSAVVAGVRSALHLPQPVKTAPPIPSGAELDIPGLGPLVTPNEEFYRIDTALVVPQVDPANWSLRIHGMVDREVVIGWDELLALGLETSYTTLMCVSNQVGGYLVGNALWLGYPVRDLLARAGVRADADMVLSRSVDGFTASCPLEALTDDRNAILAVGMNGEPLPPEHGFPARLVVPGLYGYVSATKWVTELEVTRFDRARAYWTDRGWSERGPVKLQSRIDVPRVGASVPADQTAIAGVAWHQHIGVAGVEVQIDDGPWTEATLATAISEDTWVQWHHTWNATPGAHVIRCRAISADGQVQTADIAPPAPDGATGHHEITVTVA